MLLPGIIFYVAGLIMKIKPPQNINSLYGYRSTKSMKNQTNWNVAQQYSGMQCRKIGLIFLFIGALLCVLFWNTPSWILPSFIISAVITSAIVIMISTERHLEKTEKANLRKQVKSIKSILKD